MISGLSLTTGFISNWLVLGNNKRGPYTYDQGQFKSDEERDEWLVSTRSTQIQWQESTIVPSAGMTTNGRTWTVYKDNCAMTSTCSDGCNGKGIDLSCHFHGKGDAGTNCKTGAQKCENDITYVATYLVSNSARKVEFKMASNDGHMIWFNGELIASKVTGKRDTFLIFPYIFFKM